MPKSIVVDANVIAYGCTGDGDCPMDCVTIFVKINEGVVWLGVDSGGEILEEYKKNLIEYGKSPIAKMLSTFISKEIQRTTGERKIKAYIPISERKVDELLRMGFHRKDIKYVRIAPRTDLRTIFSTDNRSFLNPEYSTWLKCNLNVDAKHPSDFMDFISQISNP